MRLSGRRFGIFFASLSIFHSRAFTTQAAAFWARTTRIWRRGIRSSSSSTASSSSDTKAQQETIKMSMAKLDAPSAQRNKEPIWEVLSSKVFPTVERQGETPLRVLEIAAGSGVHSHHFSLSLENSGISFAWYPSDPDATSRASIQAYLDDESILKGKLQPPVDLSLVEDGAVDRTFLQDKTFDVIICINMIHISPWTATLGLMKLAGENLVEGGMLYLYGPYFVGGAAVESNLRFDASLRSRDPSWGVRNVEDVIAAAEKNGFVHRETVPMPANNLSVLLEKKGA